MASAEKERARNFVQLLWRPRAGDRILLKRDRRHLRGRVEVENQGVYLTSIFPGEFLTSRQMFFVPRQSDYIELLWRFVQDHKILLEDLKDGRFQMVRRYKKIGATRETSVFFVGSPMQIVSNILNMRLQDIEMNEYINWLVLGDPKAPEPQN